MTYPYFLLKDNLSELLFYHFLSSLFFHSRECSDIRVERARILPEYRRKIFVILLIISGISDFIEVGIGVCTFLFSWLAVSYSIRNFGKGGTSKQELQKEMQVFSIILLIVLVLITLVGVNQYSDYAFVTFGFTLTWIIRSLAIKYFS